MSVQLNGIFNSFVSAGFESACHKLKDGRRLDMIAATQHDVQIEEDYTNLKKMGIRTARDGIRWHLIEKDGNYDFASLAPMVDAAKKHDVQVIWTLCHYGWPDDADPFSADFPQRFAKYCEATARFIKSRNDAAPFYTPINEISFLTTMAGDSGHCAPYGKNRGPELKKQLVRAAIAGMDAIWKVDPRARFVHVDPVINVMPPRNRPELGNDAAIAHENQFEASDMLAGFKNPELGGNIKYLDIIGMNFYAGNQWEHFGDVLPWHVKPRDDRWRPLHKIAADIHARYQRPLMLGETSHVGVGRAEWMREITDEVEKIRTSGIPFEGICLYPAIDRMDWDNPNHWHNSGLWDFDHAPDGKMIRVLKVDYAAEVRRAERIFDPGLSP